MCTPDAERREQAVVLAGVPQDAVQGAEDHRAARNGDADSEQAEGEHVRLQRLIRLALVLEPILEQHAFARRGERRGVVRRDVVRAALELDERRP